MYPSLSRSIFSERPSGSSRKFRRQGWPGGGRRRFERPGLGAKSSRRRRMRLSGFLGAPKHGARTRQAGRPRPLKAYSTRGVRNLCERVPTGSADRRDDRPTPHLGFRGEHRLLDNVHLHCNSQRANAAAYLSSRYDGFHHTMTKGTKVTAHTSQRPSGRPFTVVLSTRVHRIPWLSSSAARARPSDEAAPRCSFPTATE